MAKDGDGVERVPWWSWVAPAVGVALLVAIGAGRVAGTAPVVLLAAAATQLGSVVAAVHHAEVVALKVGEPLGSILLALAVTVIEVALILSLMLSAAGGGEGYARDTVYAAVMIVLNGVVGASLVLGGARHFEQTFQVEGAAASLGVLGTLATIALILPNATMTTPGPTYATSQLVVVGVASLLLYGVFVFVQTVRHRDYFLADGDGGDAGHAAPSTTVTAWSAGLGVLAIVVVVALAKVISVPLKSAIVGAGLPESVIGVVIASLVLLPEASAALLAARRNRLQTSLNLALGSALASIGLTIPVVAGAAIVLKTPLALGINPANTTLLALTLFVATLTLGTGRTTVLQGAIHLVIFAIFLLIATVP